MCSAGARARKERPHPHSALPSRGAASPAGAHVRRGVRLGGASARRLARARACGAGGSERRVFSASGVASARRPRRRRLRAARRRRSTPADVARRRVRAGAARAVARRRGGRRRPSPALSGAAARWRAGLHRRLVRPARRRAAGGAHGRRLRACAAPAGTGCPGSSGPAWRQRAGRLAAHHLR